MMKTALLAAARYRMRPAIAATAAVRPLSSNAFQSWVQYWWPPESRGFDINHETINPESAHAIPTEKPMEAALTVNDVSEQDTVSEEECKRTNVDSQSWWPPETRGFDIDHDNENAKAMCTKPKVKVTIPQN